MEDTNLQTTEDSVEHAQENSATQPEKKKSRTSWVIAGILLMILLIGAAFVGGSLLNQQQSISSDGMEIDFTEADGVPKTEPALSGMVSGLDGDTLIVQEFSMNDTLGMAGEGGVMLQSIEVADPEDMEEQSVVEFFGADGPSTEVVITHDTEIYKDTTFENFNFVMEEGAMPKMPDKIEQKIEPGSAGEIGPNAFVTVWGERRGDRVIATFILYEPPMNFGGEDGK